MLLLPSAYDVMKRIVSSYARRIRDSSLPASFRASSVNQLSIVYPSLPSRSTESTSPPKIKKPPSCNARATSKADARGHVRIVFDFPESNNRHRAVNESVGSAILIHPKDASHPCDSVSSCSTMQIFRERFECSTGAFHGGSHVAQLLYGGSRSGEKRGVTPEPR